MKQTLHAGDLCVVDGYGNRVWEVVGYTFEKSFMEGNFYEEIIYNLSCIMSSEWTIGVQEDVQLVCKAKYAYQYVRELNEKGLPPSNSEQYISPKWQKGEMSMKSLSNSKDGKEPFKYPDTIDGLLMKISDLSCLEDELGENEDRQNEISKVKEELEQKRLEKLS